MAVIEKFLLKQLADSVKEAKRSSNHSSHLPPNLSQLEDDCRELEGLMGKKAPQAGAAFDPKMKILEKLYCLNNAMLRLKRPRHHLIMEAPRHLDNHLHHSLTEIKTVLERVPDGLHSPTHSEIYRWSSRLADPTVKIYGLEDRSMERLLVRTESDNSFKAIGMVGMAGVGKTALCQVSFHNRAVKKRLFPRIWVCLSKQPKDDADYRKEAVKRIFTCLGYEDKVVDKIGREGGMRWLLFALRQELEGKRYLLVLDDVRDLGDGARDFWTLFHEDANDKDQLSHGLPKGHGGTVIVTSRSRKMAAGMVGEKNLYSISPHADKERCWDIFMNVVKKDGTSVLPDNVEKLKDMIVEKCDGLPLAAKMMGQIGHQKKKNYSTTKSPKPNPQLRQQA